MLVFVMNVVSCSIANKDLLPHSPYSPTEAPTDNHLNRSLKSWLANKTYDELNDLVDGVKAWIASKKQHFFARGIDRLPGKREAVLKVDGDYAPE
uniref:RxLR effector protein n=1 Tax=Haemonchus contortus TaxID=6289 RepID=A0A7I5EBC7_HAECO